MPFCHRVNSFTYLTSAYSILASPYTYRVPPFCHRLNAHLKNSSLHSILTAKYRIYLLPASEEAGTIFNFMGTVTELGSGIALENVAITLGGDILVIISDSNGKFGGALIPAHEYTAHIVLDGYLSKDVPVNIVDGQIFVAHIEMEKYHGE